MTRPSRAAGSPCRGSRSSQQPSPWWLSGSSSLGREPGRRGTGSAGRHDRARRGCPVAREHAVGPLLLEQFCLLGWARTARAPSEIRWPTARRRYCVRRPPGRSATAPRCSARWCRRPPPLPRHQALRPLADAVPRDSSAAITPLRQRSARGNCDTVDTSRPDPAHTLEARSGGGWRGRHRAMQSTAVPWPCCFRGQRCPRCHSLSGRNAIT